MIESARKVITQNIFIAPMLREFYYAKTWFGAIMIARSASIPGQELIKQFSSRQGTFWVHGERMHPVPDIQAEFLSLNNDHEIAEGEMRREIVKRTGCAACNYHSRTKRYIRVPGYFPQMMVLECDAVKLRKSDCPCQPHLKQLKYPRQRVFSSLKSILVNVIGHPSNIPTELDP